MTKGVCLLAVSGLLTVAMAFAGHHPRGGAPQTRALSGAPTYHLEPGRRWTFDLRTHWSFLVLPRDNRRDTPLLNDAAITTTQTLRATTSYRVLSHIPGGALVQESDTNPATITGIGADGVPLGIGAADQITEGFWWTKVGVGILPHHAITPSLRWSSSHPLRVLIEDPAAPSSGVPSASALTVGTRVVNAVMILTASSMTVSTTATLLQHDVAARYQGKLVRYITAVHMSIERFAYHTTWVFNLKRGQLVSAHSSLTLRARLTYTIPHKTASRMLMQYQTLVMDMRVT